MLSGVMPRVRVIIRGLVQGVGFRWFVQRRAAALGVRGWVANRRDGGVEVEAEGVRSGLEALVDALRQGPSRAHVTDVVTAWGEGSGEHEGFVIRDRESG
jgi:acylphosphatase